MSHSGQNSSHTRVIQYQGALKCTVCLPPELLLLTARAVDSRCSFGHLSVSPTHFSAALPCCCYSLVKALLHSDPLSCPPALPALQTADSSYHSEVLLSAAFAPGQDGRARFLVNGFKTNHRPSSVPTRLRDWCDTDVR